MRHSPERVKTTPVIEWNAGQDRPVDDDVAVEEPLEIRLDGAAVSVTMRTPGDDFELATGFLFTERIIARRDDIARVEYGQDPDGQPSGNVVDVTLRAGKPVDLARLQRHFYAASSCGVCGKASICAVRVGGIMRPRGDLRVGPALLARLPGVLREVQAVFERTGGLHAAALFDAGGALHDIREDVGRHNTVDKIIGHALLEGKLPLSQHLLLVSGPRGVRDRAEGARRRCAHRRVRLGAVEPGCRPRPRAWPYAHRVPARSTVRRVFGRGETEVTRSPASFRNA
jgi:FdhD protein